MNTHATKQLRYIMGTFGKKRIFYRLDKTKSTQLTIFFHGAYSSTLTEKYTNIIRQLKKRKYKSDFLCYETSRKHYSFEDHALPFEAYAQTFSGKTFQDELEDVKTLLQHIRIDRYDSLVFVGYSLGGTLSSFFIRQHTKKIKGIYLFGSGISTNRKTYPILSTYPNSSTILQNFKGYTGTVTLVQGTEDTIVPQEDAGNILAHAISAERTTHIRLKGVDHRFITKFGKCAEDELDEIAARIISAN